MTNETGFFAGKKEKRKKREFTEAREGIGYFVIHLAFISTLRPAEPKKKLDSNQDRACSL